MTTQDDNSEGSVYQEGNMLNSTDNLARLPGVLCETRMPNLGSRPLRLDVAAFIGLAERGPLDVPVLVEDISQYRLIFGGDLPLARVDGRPLFAHLPRAVEAFFENGGRRCYVVRVAGPGNRPNQFQLPGLLYDAGNNDWQPAIVPAAWPGRWSDLVSLAGSLRRLPLQIRIDSGPLEIDGRALNDTSFSLPLRLPSPTALRAGDLLRLHLQRAGGEHYYFYTRAGTVEQQPATAAELFGIPAVVKAAAAGRLFRTDPVPFGPQSVAWLTASGWVDLPYTPADYTWSVSDGVYRLTMPPPDPDPAAQTRIEAGTLLRLSGLAGTSPVFLVVEEVQRGPDPACGGDVCLLLDSANPLQPVAAAANEPHELTQVDLLSFDLLIREGETTLESWPDLRFGTGTGGWPAMLQPAVDMNDIDPAAFTVDDFSGRSLRLGAAGDDGDPLVLPLGLGVLPVFQGPRADRLRDGKDGLDTFDPAGLFIDPDFAVVGVRNLLNTADDLLHLAAEPRRLRAMHSLIPVDEVALVAVPDLAHLGWSPFAQPTFVEPVPEEPEEERPWGFYDCPPDAELPPEDDCPAVPVVALKMTGVVADPSSQAWLESLPEQLTPAEYDEDGLLDVQRALIRLCAARADMVALLNLPQHYDSRAASQWHEKLANTAEFYDGDPLSYAAPYHGWPAIREETTPWLAPLRYLPPDGFAAGMIAARELRRGAWIAPANVALQNVVDLRPEFGDQDWAGLFQRRINVLRHPPGRYLLLSAMTLARDRSFRQLSVRRLLILLRKLALREGQRYVFETNNERFRALVQTYFENILTQILERGGLQAFQVVTNEEINTQNDYDNGRFIIALKVAPTLPIEFITITMLRSGDDVLTILES
jgi:hypothetical protein